MMYVRNGMILNGRAAGRGDLLMPDFSHTYMHTLLVMLFMPIKAIQADTVIHLRDELTN